MIAETDWYSTGAAMAAAGGTLVLAFFTWRLATSTKGVVTKADAELEQGRDVLDAARSQAEATSRQAIAARATLAAAMQPVVVPVVERRMIETLTVTAADGSSIHVGQMGHLGKIFQQSSSQSIWAVVPVRNVGTGAALFSSQAGVVVILSSHFGGFRAEGRPTSRVVAPGDVVDIAFRGLPGSQPGPVPAGRPGGPTPSAVVSLSYMDLSGRETRTVITYEGTGLALDPFDVDVTLPDYLIQGVGT